MGFFDSLLDSFIEIGSNLFNRQKERLDKMSVEEIETEMTMIAATGDVALINYYISYLQRRCAQIDADLQKLDARKKPGALCHHYCWIDDERCQECLKDQQNFWNSLQELVALENAAAGNIPAAPQTKKSTCCELCGAPYSKKASECPFCGTPYPLDAFAEESSFRPKIPKVTSPSDYKLLAMRKAEDVWGDRVVIYIKQTKRMASCPNPYPGVNYDEKDICMQMVMSGDELRHGAAKYDVSFSTYIKGVISGDYISVAKERYDEQKSKKEKADREAYEKERQRRQENYERELSMVMGNTPNYMGAPLSSVACCGNCIHYIGHDNKCAESDFHHPRDANYYCIDFVRK